MKDLNTNKIGVYLVNEDPDKYDSLKIQIKESPCHLENLLNELGIENIIALEKIEDIAPDEPSKCS